MLHNSLTISSPHRHSNGTPITEKDDIIKLLGTDARSISVEPQVWTVWMMWTDCVMFKIGVLRQTSHTALLSAIIWECVSYTLGIARRYYSDFVVGGVVLLR